MIQQVFLDWSRPIVESAAEWLWQKGTERPRDFSSCFVLVPTRQSGRSLRQALARRAAAEGTGLIGLRVGLPRELVQPRANRLIAPPLLEQALWAELLAQADNTCLPALHLPPAPRSWLWSLQTAQTIQNLRLELTEAERSVADVVSLTHAKGWESERWRAIAELERQYLDRLETIGYSDRCEEERRAALDPAIGQDIRHLVVAGVPDLAPLFVRALESLAARCTLTILVHAPADQADVFDPWGRPIPDRWEQLRWSIPNWRETVIPVEEPAKLGTAFLHTLSACLGRFPLDKIAIGTTDPLLGGFLLDPLERQGFVVFDPARQPLSRHPVLRLLVEIQNLARQGDYPALSQFLRHADVLRHLSKPPHSIEPATLLTELDTFQNLYLPHSIEDFTSERLEGRTLFNTGQPSPVFPALQTAVGLAASVANRLRTTPPAEAIFSALAEFYGDRTLQDRTPEDRIFRQVITQLADQLADWQTVMTVFPHLPPDPSFLLLKQALANQAYTPPASEADFEIQGWLELHWNDAPVLAIAGMNEGYVPGVRHGDAWLPNSLREALGLPSDRTVAARDHYLLRALIESRQNQGHFALYCLRKGADGEPLKPSRLLFQGSDSDLLPLAEHLLRPQQGKGSRPLPRSRIRLHPLLDAPGRWPVQKPLPVTAFRDYLDDPFLFYLKNVLKLEERTDTKLEPDEKDFGALIHAAAHAISRLSPDIVPSEQALLDQLQAAADAWMTARFGPSLDTACRAILGSARNRLAPLARWQWNAWQNGWRLLACEYPLKAEFGGLNVHGRADHIAWHPESRTLRILDLKTGSSRDRCAPSHLGPIREETPEYATVLDSNGRRRRWQDLQLPLYVLMWRHENHPAPDRIEAGYLRLPPQPPENPLDLWPDLNETLLQSARHCAENVAAAIRNGFFGTTSARARFLEPYRTRFGGDLGDLFDFRQFSHPFS